MNRKLFLWRKINKYDLEKININYININDIEISLG